MAGMEAPAPFPGDAPLCDTPLYARPERAALNGADRALADEFAERGFVIIDLALADETIAGIIDRMAPLFPAGADRRVLNAWRKVEAVRALALHEQALATLEMLYGRTPFAFQTLNFPVGTEQLTHSDTIHFDSTPHDFMAGVWVALEDTDAGNGPLHYYPGSHRLPRVTLETMGLRGGRLSGSANYRQHYEPTIQRLVREHGLAREEAHLKRGQALIWAANLLHGGCPIREPGRSRHSQVTHYYFEGCTYWTPLLSRRNRRFERYPYNVRTGRNVTPTGESPIHQELLRMAGPLLWGARNGA